MPDFSQLIQFLDRLNPFQHPLNWLDILLVALLFWWLLNIIQGTRAVQLLRGISILLIATFALSQVLQLQTLQWLMSEIIQPTLVVAVPILFGPELRRALERLGRADVFALRPFNQQPNDGHAAIDTTVRAVAQLSRQRTGALIVIERATGLQEYADRGVILDARVSVPLLLSIFFVNSPLHDLAVIIRDDRVLAANVVLPLSENIVGTPRYGSRHRAALGISEVSDAIAVVVSEETGGIAVATNGRMVRQLSDERLRKLLAELLNLAPMEAA
jgi:uncharacterized protein (TIGR00159 family)